MVPADNERGPRYMERALAAIHEAHLYNPPIVLSYGSVAGEIALLVDCNSRQQPFVLDPMTANYPQCSLSAVKETKLAETWATWSCDVSLRPELFPILRHAQFEDLLNHNFADPISGLLRAIRPTNRTSCRIEISVTRASHWRCHEALTAIRRLDRVFFRHHHHLAAFYARNILRGRWRWMAWLLGRMALNTPIPGHTLLETSTSRLHEREEDLQGAADKLGGHLFEAQIRLIASAPRGRKQLAVERLEAMVAALGTFTKSRLAHFHAGPIQDDLPWQTGTSFLISHEELATLWHPPTVTAAAEKMQSNEFVEFEAPAEFDSKEEGSVVLGRVQFRDDTRPVPLMMRDRRRHLYICGKTGMGKTTLLQNMITADIFAGRGVCVVDPHGDLAESILAQLPSHRTNEVLYFDAADRVTALPFNPLACPDPARIDQVTSGVVSVFKKLHDSWGPRLEDTLRNAAYATVEQQGNLLSLMRLLGEHTYREQTVVRIRDDVVRSFWLHEFARWSDSYRTEAVAAIQNKLRPFVVNSNIRAIVTHTAPSLNLRQIMDAGQILIVNLSKGRLGEDNSALLGAFLVSSLQEAAMTRADIPEAERRDFYLYVDEFQNFTTGSFATMLSEARKFRLALIVAHQYLSQLDEETANAVWGNVGSIVSFQVGSDDAEVLAKQLGKFEGQLKPQNLTGLPAYKAYARLLMNGMPSRPFSLRTLPPTLGHLNPDRPSIIRGLMARRFGATSKSAGPPNA